MANEVVTRLVVEDHYSRALDGYERAIQGSTRATSGLSAAAGQLTSAFGLTSVSAAGVTAAVGAVAVATFKLGEEFDAASDKIVIATGASGQALADLEQSARRVFTTIPTDIGSAATAVASFSQRLELTGAPLERLSRQMLELSRITGTDLATNTRQFTRFIQDWQIPVSQASDQLDRLFTVSQRTGVSVGELSSLLVRFGAPLRQVGFSVAEATELLGQFERQGVNTEQVTTSLRIAISELLERGVQDIPGAFREAIRSIQEAGSVAEGNRIAFEVFGRRAGADMAEAIRQGRFSLAELNTDLATTRGAILETAERTADAAERMTVALNRIKSALQPVGTGVFDAAAAAVERYAQAFDSLAERRNRALGAYQAAREGGHALQADILGQQFERQYGMTPEVAAQVRELEAAANSAREAGAALWDTWEAEAKGAAQATAEVGQAIQTAADLEIWIEHTRGLADLQRAYKELPPAIAAATMALEHEHGQTVAIAQARRELEAQSERNRQAQEATRQAKEAERDATRALAEAERELERAYRHSVAGRLDALREQAAATANQREAERQFAAERGEYALRVEEYDKRYTAFLQGVANAFNDVQAAEIEFIRRTEGAGAAAERAGEMFGIAFERINSGLAGSNTQMQEFIRLAAEAARTGAGLGGFSYGGFGNTGPLGGGYTGGTTPTGGGGLPGWNTPDPWGRPPGSPGWVPPHDRPRPPPAAPPPPGPGFAPGPGFWEPPGGGGVGGTYGALSLGGFGSVVTYGPGGERGLGPDLFRPPAPEDALAWALLERAYWEVEGVNIGNSPLSFAEELQRASSAVKRRFYTLQQGNWAARDRSAPRLAARDDPQYRTALSGMAVGFTAGGGGTVLAPVGGGGGLTSTYGGRGRYGGGAEAFGGNSYAINVTLAPAIMGTDPMAAQRVGEQIAEISAEAMARRLRSTGRVA